VALLLTLVVLTVVAVVVLELNYLVRVDVHAAANFRDGVKAYYLAKSGVNVVKALFGRDFSRELPDLETLKDGLLAGRSHTQPLGDNSVTVRVVDEEGKINLNALLTATGTAPSQPQRDWYQVTQELFQRLGLDPTLVAAIVDWIDQDDIPTSPGGAESSYYRSLEKPYAARDGPMETVAELRLVKGFTDEVLLKLGAKRVGGIVDAATNVYLTVLPAQQGGWKINLNTAPPLILSSLTSDGEQFTEVIVQQRSKERIKKMGDLQKLVTREAWQDIQRLGTTETSKHYFVQASGDVGGVIKHIAALIRTASDQGGQILYWRVQ
jgi:general secretion pathway protein K